MTIFVSAIIRSGDSVLIQDHVKCNMLTIPIGKVELDETPKQAIVRELKEELGVTKICILDCTVIANPIIDGSVDYIYEVKLNEAWVNNEPNAHRWMDFVSLEELLATNRVKSNSLLYAIETLKSPEKYYVETRHKPQYPQCNLVRVNESELKNVLYRLMGRHHIHFNELILNRYGFELDEVEYYVSPFGVWVGDGEGDGENSILIRPNPIAMQSVPNSPIRAIVAHGANYVEGHGWPIGRSGFLCANLPGELKIFKERTMGGVLIMGRKTFDSMNQQTLPGRFSIVVTSNPLENNERFFNSNVVFVSSKEEALIIARNVCELMHYKGIWILGGGEIYKLFENEIDSWVVTEANIPFKDADTFVEFDEKWKGESTIYTTPVEIKPGYTIKCLYMKEGRHHG